MHRNHHAIIFVFLFVAFLGFAPRAAQAQTYVFGTASYATAGTGPTIAADFNGDGIADLAVLGVSTSGSQAISILMGKPDGTFAPKVDYALQASGFSAQSSGFTVGDFNGDGKLDIIFANSGGSPSAGILLGNGDGTFQSPTALNQTLPYGTNSTVASADFNGDGKLDLVFRGSGTTMVILLGIGDGTFETPVSYTVPASSYISIGDFNGDGNPDIALSGGTQVSVLINKGDGTFLNHVDYTVSGQAKALAAADLNGDGKLDLIVPTGGSSAGVSVLLGFGDGTFATPLVYTSSLLSIYSGSVAIADFNGDGKPDLAITPTNVTALNANAVAILLGNGDGTFQNPPLYYSAGLNPKGIIALDINGDGKPDLAVAGGYGAYLSVTTLINRGDGSFPQVTAYPALKYPQTAIQGDFDGDGKVDIAVASITTNSTGQDNGGAISVFLGKGDGTFQPRLDSVTTNFPLVIASGDFNKDGKPDVVAIEGKSTGVMLSTWIGNGDGTFQHNISQSLSANARYLAVGDFNGDGNLDVAATVDYAGAVYVFLGNGDGTFSSPTTFATGAGASYPGYHLAAADFNGDGKLDLAVATDQGISILFGNGDGTFRSYTPILAGESLLIVSDLNGDGKPDLAITPNYGGTLYVALGKGDGTFQLASTSFPIPSILGLSSPTVGDFDGDGKLDIAFSSQSENLVTILFGNGDGTFTRHFDFATAQAPALVAADFNGDGALDLAMADVTNQNMSVFLNTPVAAFYPSRLNFGSQPKGTPSPVQTVSMSNPSPAPIPVASIGTGGDFSQTNTCGFNLLAGTSCLVSVTFTPTVEGVQSGTLIFTDGAPGSPQQVPLTGAGVVPGVQLTTSSLDFSSQILGTTSTTKSITLTNTGNGVLTIASIGVSGDFAQTNTCGSQVNLGGTCSLSVTFTPTVLGGRTGAITITDSAPDSPQTISLTGTGIVPAASLSATTLAFTGQLVSSTSTAQAVTLNNTGTAPMTLTSIVASGDFAQTNTCGSSVAAGSGCTINVTFQPTASGSRTGSITITDNAPDSPQIIGLTGTGTVPAASLSATSLTFSGQLVNSTSTAQVVTLNNAGTAPMTLTGIVASGDFAQTNTCGSSVAAGSGCAINVTFQPSASGSRTGSITITDNAPDSPQIIGLTGTGTVPAASLSATTLTFTGQLVSSTSTAQVVTLNNTGTAPMTLTSIVASGDFAQTNTCGSSVAAGSGCTINVTFTPTGGGSRTGSITITDNSPNSPQTITLSGTGTAPAASLSPASLTFPGQLVSSTSASQPITLNNTGTAAMALTSIVASGDFAQTNNCGTSVAAGSGCTISVTFTPTASGSRTGSITITDSAPDSPQTIGLTGAGTVPAASLSATNLSFTGQLVNSTSTAQVVTLNNTGTAAMTLTSIVVSGDFAQTNNCGTSVAAGATCTINVTFTPAASGNRTGSITLTDNADNSPQTVSLTGTGEDFTLTLPSGSSSTANITAGQSANYSLSLGGLGGLNQAINFTCTGAPSEATCTVNPSSATPGASGTVSFTVTVATTAATVVAPTARRMPPLGSGMEHQTIWWALLGLSTLALIIINLVVQPPQRKRLGWGLGMVLLAMLALSMAACGGGGGGGGVYHNPGTPAGTYTLTITGTPAGSANLQHSMTLTLKVG